jgi:diguanylate cyclase (GGDEF)-like protein
VPIHRSARHDPEGERLRAIRVADLRDHRLVADLEDLVRLAAVVTSSPMAAVTLIDQDLQLLLCTHGIEPQTTPRKVAFCEYTIQGHGPMVVVDTESDPRFHNNPVVAGAPHIRSYAGVPVHVGSVPFGALCVMDVHPRAQSTEQLDLLRSLARQVDLVVELHHLRKATTAPDEESVQRMATAIGSAEEFDEMLGGYGLPAWIIEPRSQRFLVANEATERVYGWTPEELGTLRAPELLAAREAELLSVPSARLPHGADLADDPAQLAFWSGRRFLHQDRDGDVFEVRVALAPMRFEGVDALLCVLSDVGDGGADDLAVERAAAHDPLTGLGNRRLLDVSLDARLGTSQPLVLLMVDLDRFALLNEVAGHRRGDELLVGAAARLSALLPVDATAVRYGGDEFAVLLAETRIEDAQHLAERIRRALGAPYLLAVGEHSVTASVAVANGVPPMTGSDVLTLATDAIEVAKAAGGDCVVVADASLRERHSRRERIQSQLAEAEEREELQLYYQPVVALEGPRAGEVDMVEALLRWHPDRSALMAPARFLDVAERAGLMVPIGRWVLGEACAAAARWRETGRDLVVSVNCTVRQFTARIPGDVADSLARHDLPGDRLVIEITEGAIIEDHDRTARVIDQLAAMGVRVVIDDFGSGYTSLGRLQELAVAGLKIDPAFLLGLSTTQGFGLYRAMVEMADACGLAVTAEGVETARQLNVVTGLGCAAAQGFLLGRAAPEEVVPEKSAYPVAASRERSDLLDRYGPRAG